MEADGMEVSYSDTLECLQVMAQETRDCQEVFTSERLGSFTTLQTYIVVASKHSKDELNAGVGRPLRYQMRESLEKPWFYDSPEGHFTKLALALKTTVLVALYSGRICRKDKPGATFYNAVLENILPTHRVDRGDTWGESWTVRLSFNASAKIEETHVVSYILDCIDIMEDID